MKNCRMHILIETIKLLFLASKFMLVFIIIINTLLGLAVPINLLVWRNFIDSATTLFSKSNINFNSTIYWLVIYFIIIFFTILLEELLDYVQNIYGSYVDLEISNKLLSKIELFEMKDFDNSEIFNYIQKATNESYQRSMSILQIIMQIVKSVVAVIGIIVNFLSFSKLIIVLCMISTLPIFYLNNKILKKWYNIFNSRFEKIRFAKFLKGICIKYENIKELKIYRAQSYLRKKIVDILKQNITEDKKIRKNFLMQNLAIHEIDIIVLFFIKLIVILKSFNKNLSIGSLITYLQSVDILKNSIKNTLSMISKTYENSLYMESFFHVMEYQIEEEKKIEFKKEFEKIEFKNVWFKYPEAKEYVIKNFNFTFKANNTYGLVGLNGSGKTTLLKLVLRIYKPDKGEILIDNVNLCDINENSMYKHVSAVFQDFIKYPFNIKENIAVANSGEVSDIDLIIAAEFSGIYDFIKSLPQGFMTKLQKEWENGTEVSIGQWQKIAISRSYLKDSSIIVLDEPTASIDAVAEHNMFNNFSNLQKNRLCILVTHRFSSIKLADQILVMEDGELKEYGTHEELIKKGGKYQELYSLQAEAYQK